MDEILGVNVSILSKGKGVNCISKSCVVVFCLLFIYPCFQLFICLFVSLLVCSFS